MVVTNEYDGFADFPDRPGNLLAVANAVMGLFYRHGQTSTATLTGVPAHDISTTVNALGATTTTYLIPCISCPDSATDRTGCLTGRRRQTQRAGCGR